MESDDAESDTDTPHTFTSIGLATRRLVQKLRTQLRMKGPDAEAPGKSVREETEQEARQSDFRKGKPSAPPLKNRREAEKL